MELYQLRTFVTVAREGNLTRAAERLFTSQPAVSAHIKALEEEFGLKLFERTPGGMVPTAAGESLWDEAERLLAASKDLSQRAEFLKGRVAGTLRLGLNNDVSMLRTTDLVASLAESYPALRFELVYGTSGALYEAVIARELDAAFYEGALTAPAVQAVPLTHLELVVVTPPAWAAELEAGGWSALERRPWVVGTPHCSFERFMEEIATEHGVQPDRRFVLNDDATTLGLVAAGLAVAMTTREAMLALPGMGERVHVWSHFRRRVPLSLFFLANRANDPLIRELTRVAKSMRPAPPAAGAG